VTTWYIDTSAALKLIVEESESEVLLAELRAERPSIVSSRLLETELRRAVFRNSNLEQRTVTQLLTGVNISEITPAIMLQAGLLPGAQLRSLDAIHLATAINIGAAQLLTYDRRMAEAAELLGLPVVSPN